MPTYQPSPEQLLAIETHGENLLVAAGAGSGKTTVLVERLLRKLTRPEQPGSLQRMLVLTFTNAAAADMRAKIDAALTTLAREQPGNRHILLELNQLPQASISTIHSFCLNLLRRYYYRLELDGGFRIAREAEMSTLTQQVLEDYLEARYEQQDGKIQLLADAYGGSRDDSKLAELIEALYEFSRSQPNPAQWLQQACNLKGETVDDFAFSADLAAYIGRQTTFALEPLEQAALLLQEAPALLPDAWRQSFQQEYAICRALAASPQPLHQQLALLAELEFLPWRGGKKDENKPFREEFKALRKQAKELLQELKQRFASREPAILTRELNRLGQLTQLLEELVEGFGLALAQEKRRRNLIDFGDMEHFAHQLLQQEDIAQELRQNYDEVLIDEYQDINAVQEEILRLVQRGNNCFAVGDVKQSIYRFRLAEPSLFLDKYVNYGALSGGRRIDLNRNYRSVGAVIDGVNYIFSQLMTKQSAEMAYDQAASLKPGRAEYGAPPELMLLDLSGKNSGIAPEETEPTEEEAEEATQTDSEQGQAENQQETREEQTAAKAEAIFLISRIRELVQEGYTYGQMAVLLRNAKNKTVVLAQALTAAGIPAMADNQENVLDAPETALLLSLLRIIDNPRQDLPLGAVLRSPLFGFTPEQLAEIRLFANGEFYQAVTACARESSDLAAKCQDFLTRLADWRYLAQRERVSVLIRKLWQDTGLYLLVGALPEGDRRQANLDALYTQACAYEAGDYGGLYRFLRYLEQYQKQGGQLPAAGRQKQTDAVQIMSIHRSKGLEFPVVFVAGLACRFHGASERRDILFHKDLGLGPKIADREKRLQYPSLAYQALAAKLDAETTAEEMRIFYVALTRARDRLILCAALRNPATTLAAWSKTAQNSNPTISPSVLQKDKRPIDWIGRALLRHPDGEVLRQAAQDGSILPGAGCWKISLCTPEQLAPTAGASHLAAGQADSQKQDWLPPQDPICEDAVAKALGYRYPHGASCAYPIKWTVSQLTAADAAEADAAANPDTTNANAAPTMEHMPAQVHTNQLAPHATYDKERAASSLAPQNAVTAGLPLLLQATPQITTTNREEAAYRGTINHLLLEKLDLRRGIPPQIQELIDQGLLQQEQAQFVDLAMLEGFVQSPLGQRAIRAKQIQRETAFTMTIPASDRVDAYPADTLILQGTMDLAFQEMDGWVLVDYKTGGFGQTDGQLLQRYRGQLFAYRQAIERLWRQPVKELYLYLLDQKRAIPVQ